MPLPTNNDQLPNDAELNTQPTQPPTQQPAQQPARRQSPAASVSQDPRQQAYQPVAQSTDFSEQISLIKNILVSMTSGAVVRPLLAGDTGLGKTSFVKQFSKLTGIPLVVIEVPHIVEEELINIPFLVRLPTGQTSSGTETFSKEGELAKYGITMAKSYLATTLEQLHKQSDAEYANSISRLDAHSKELLDQFNEEYPDLIPEARGKYERILFLDEYFRQTSPTVRNILRGILNRRIGNDKIPSGTFELYASNVIDTGLETKSSQHATFHQMGFNAPTIKQWLGYMVSGDLKGSVPFKHDVITTFIDTVKDEHLSFTDINNSIRTSPRRWSEILLSVNNAYPFKSANEASIIKSSMTRQFKTDDDKSSPVITVVIEMLDKLIAKSGIKPNQVRSIPRSQWRDVLVNNVMARMSIGERKKYVPVVQGPPGIGKTAIATAFENSEYNLRFIPVSCESLDNNSVTGIPTAEKTNKGMITNFTEPPLYMQILREIKQAESEYMQLLQEKEAEGKLGNRSAQETYKAWENQEYKYLIFFDEINRVEKPSVFNALRRVILEKEFNDKYSLPAGSVVVGAMNPGDLGTTKLTGHFKDAIEIIDAAADWKDFVGHLQSMVIPDIVSDYNPDESSVKSAFKIISEFPGVFAGRGSRPDQEFYMNIGSVDTIYISPRAFTQLFINLVKVINEEIKRIKSKTARGQQLSSEDASNIVVDAAYQQMEHMLDDEFRKNKQSRPPGVMERVKQFLYDNIDIVFKKTVTAAGLASLLDEHIAGETPLWDDPDFISYMKNYSPAGFHRELEDFMKRHVSNFMDMSGSSPTIHDEDGFDKFFIDTGVGSIIDTVKAIERALSENDLETAGPMDEVRKVAFDMMKKANHGLMSVEPEMLDEKLPKLLNNYVTMDAEF